MTRIKDAKGKEYKLYEEHEDCYVVYTGHYGEQMQPYFKTILKESKAN